MTTITFCRLCANTGMAMVIGILRIWIEVSGLVNPRLQRWAVLGGSCNTSSQALVSVFGGPLRFRFGYDNTRVIIVFPCLHDGKRDCQQKDAGCSNEA